MRSTRAGLGIRLPLPMQHHAGLWDQVQALLDFWPTCALAMALPMDPGSRALVPRLCSVSSS